MRRLGQGIAVAIWLAAGVAPLAAQPPAAEPGRGGSIEWRQVAPAILRAVLLDLARRGPIGDRKVQINYAVNHPGVRLSAALRRRYPDTITIVLQHEFARLVVSRDAFSVDLWFGGRRERVTVPFAAVKLVQDVRVDHEADI